MTTTTNHKQTYSIDIGYCIADEHLYARKIWEQIFRIIEAQKFESFDSFLCDLKLFAEYAKKAVFIGKYTGKPFYFLWSDDGCWTETTDIRPQHEDKFIEIVVHRDTIDVTLWS